MVLVVATVRLSPARNPAGRVGRPTGYVQTASDGRAGTANAGSGPAAEVPGEESTIAPVHADAARVRRPHLKVLFITGYAENAALGNGHLERGMSVVTKPFEMDALARKISAMMAERPDAR